MRQRRIRAIAQIEAGIDEAATLPPERAAELGDHHGPDLPRAFFAWPQVEQEHGEVAAAHLRDAGEEHLEGVAEVVGIGQRPSEGCGGRVEDPKEGFPLGLDGFRHHRLHTPHERKENDAGLGRSDARSRSAASALSGLGQGRHVLHQRGDRAAAGPFGFRIGGRVAVAKEAVDLRRDADAGVLLEHLP
eukprot:scaffold69_cov248-Pinguiococcus_pyrenoidosus.AAC.43